MRHIFIKRQKSIAGVKIKNKLRVIFTPYTNMAPQDLLNLSFPPFCLPAPLYSLVHSLHQSITSHSRCFVSVMAIPDVA